MRVVCICVAAAMLSGCVTTETVRFQPKPDQQALVRDGQSALVSRRKNSIVLIRPAAREFRTGGRPVFVVGINNLSKGPLEFRIADVQATQAVNGELAQLKVITYEELAQEERNRQIASAVLVGLAAGANAMAASQAGYYNSRSTVYGPGGGYSVHTTGYSPAAAAILSVITLFDGLAFPLFDGSVDEFGDRFPDATEHAVVLAAVKDAARR